MIVIVNVHELVGQRLTVRQMRLDVAPDASVQHLRSLIWLADLNVPAERCYLIYDGHLMEDGYTCRDYNVLKYGNVHAIVRNRKGPMFKRKKRPATPRKRLAPPRPSWHETMLQPWVWLREGGLRRLGQAILAELDEA
jgi:hypothetical protein